jgi:hypothetical protein
MNQCWQVARATGTQMFDPILPRQVPIGMVNWDGERTLQTLYFNCQTNASDALETPEWYGLNAYQHCDAQVTSIDELVGWIQLRQDFADYNLPVPMVIAEYGCRERGFPTIDGFEAQRTWLQVDALYNQDYQEVFAGGVVFEYSAEKKVVDQSSQGNVWPYNGFMKLQYGIGHYSPIDCDHLTIPCVYNPYPEFELLKDKMTSVNVSFVPNMNDYNPAVGEIPQCPEGNMPPLSLFSWPTDAEPDLPCYTIETNPPTASPTTSPPTASPTTSPPTEQPSVVGSNSSPGSHHDDTSDNTQGNPDGSAQLQTNLPSSSSSALAGSHWLVPCFLIMLAMAIVAAVP